MKKVFVVRLTETERSELEGLVRKGKASAVTITRARILLKADQGKDGEGRTDAQVAEALSVAPKTVFNVRRRWVEEGLEAALRRKKQACSRARANSMARPRRNLWRLVAAPFRKGGRDGPCGCSPASWSNCRSYFHQPGNGARHAKRMRLSLG